MARFITVHVQCDWTDCPTVADENDGTIVEKTLAIDGKQARAFLLCKPHLEDFEELVLPLMQAGIKVEEKAPKRSRAASSGGNGTGTSSATVAPGEEAETLVCKVADCTRHGRPLHNRTGMAQHVIRSHGYENLAAYEAEFGTVANTPATT